MAPAARFRYPAGHCMSATKHDRIQEAAPHPSGNPPHPPYWRRAHRDPRVWAAAIVMLLAMTIYVMTNNLSDAPGRPLQRGLPAIAN